MFGCRCKDPDKKCDRKENSIWKYYVYTYKRVGAVAAVRMSAKVVKIKVTTARLVIYVFISFCASHHPGGGNSGGSDGTTGIISCVEK